jgi:hypothetical protein
MGNYIFVLDKRLGIEIPVLELDWEEYSAEDRMAILERWEHARGTIPDRVIALERQINALQPLVFEEEDFEATCRLNADIAELASRINDLHIWYRINQEIETRRHS